MADMRTTTLGQRWRVLVTALLAALLGIGAVWATPASALPTVRVSLGDATGLEHSDAQAGLFVPLTLSETTTSPVTLTYWTNSGTATAGADFLKWGTPNAPRTITIPAGVRQTTINVPLKPDGDNEQPETFTVVLGTVTTQNATIDRGTGTGTIFDQLTNYLVSSVSVPEGDAPGLKAQFRVELVAPSTAPITLGYSTSNGTATAGTDYTTVKPNVLKFLPGQTSKTIDVAVASNTTSQGDRTFQLNVSGLGSGTATILDDDKPAAPDAGNDSRTTAFNTAISDGTTRGNDSGTGTLTTTLVSDVAHGTLVLAATGTWTYTPTAAYVGSDSFTYKLTDSYGQDSNTATVSITVNPLVAASISAGYDGSCAVLTDSTARCWGLNTSGQLGNNSTTQSKVPVKVVNPTSTSQALAGIASISSGNAFNCAAMTDGSARCWGGNGSGQLGNNATPCNRVDPRCDSRKNDSKTPVAVVNPTSTSQALTGIASISAGDSHACALMTDGTARCWGSGNAGRLGNNSTTDSSKPVTVVDPANTANALTGIASIAAGSSHTCAVMTDSTARCWGSGTFGRLGNNAQTASSKPVTVVDPANTANALTGIASISAGNAFTCAVMTNGTARCWGANSDGRLGNNTTTQSNVAVAVVDPTNTANALIGISRISVGTSHTCARMTDGTARCWGNNNNGKLGNNSNAQSNVPVAVLDPTDTSKALGGIASISATNNHTCAVMTDGSARCWGVGLVGQLGNNATADAPTPVTVSAWG